MQPEEPESPATRIVIGATIISILGVLGLGVSAFRKWRDDAVGRTSPEAAPPAPDPVAHPRPAIPRTFDAAEAIARATARYDDGTPDGLWRLTEALRADAAQWRLEGVADAEVNSLLAHALDVENKIADRWPMFLPLRRARGEAPLREVLGAYEDFDARFLPKAEAETLRWQIRQLERTAQANHGWIARSAYDLHAGPLARKALAARREFDALLATDLGREARMVEIRDIAALDTLLPDLRFRAFYHLPYVVLVEQSPRWEELDRARDLARTLRGLRKTFIEMLERDLGLRGRRASAVPVVVFASRASYHRYRAAIRDTDPLGTEAHFEPLNDRLVVHGDAAPAIVLHEGTHQLVRSVTPMPLVTYVQALWFHEGIAEWFAGSRRLPDAADGLPRFEVGLLLERDATPGEFLGPLRLLAATPPEGRHPLATLLRLLLQDRDRLGQSDPDGRKRIELVYAQGWFLIYFLNHFAVTDDGLVRLDTAGAYRDVWFRYLRAELEGRSGPDVFLDALRPAGVTLERLESDLDAYLDFAIRKLGKRHIRDQRLIPWHEARDIDPTASEADDRLRT